MEAGRTGHYTASPPPEHEIIRKLSLLKTARASSSGARSCIACPGPPLDTPPVFEMIAIEG
jgi:hypothetical protein